MAPQRLLFPALFAIILLAFAVYAANAGPANTQQPTNAGDKVSKDKNRAKTNAPKESAFRGELFIDGEIDLYPYGANLCITPIWPLVNYERVVVHTNIRADSADDLKVMVRAGAAGFVTLADNQLHHTGLIDIDARLGKELVITSTTCKGRFTIFGYR